MPIYEITHPTNGMTIEMEGPKPPNEGQIRAAFSAIGKQATPSNDPADYPQGKSTAEAERMRQQFIAQQSQPVTVGQAFKKFGRDIITPSEPTAPASSLSDLTTRVLPESVAKLPGRLATGVYEGIKSQTDPIITGLTTEFDNPQYNIGAEMRKGAGRTLTGLAEAVVKPTGLMGLSTAKEAWSTDPAGSLLAVAPMVKPTLKGIKAGTAAAAEAIKPMSPEVAAKKITIDYQKAIRPSVKGTAGSAKQIAQSDANSIRGVYDVVEAKNSGKIALGEEAEARLPQTLQEHLDAVNQAKMDAFTQYDSMKNATEGNGVVIDLQPIANTLRESAQNKALAISRPSVIQYMLDMADRFEQTKTLNPSEVQEAIKAYNSLLDYSKATPEVAANAMVDKSIAAQLRKSIDDAITSDQGGGYGELKQKYGRLAQMEKEAAHRARVAGRAAPSSLFDGIMGGLTSAEIVSGLLTANPAQVARGGAMAAFKAWRNRMNSPDFQIKRMYKTAEKTIPRQEQ